LDFFTDKLLSLATYIKLCITKHLYLLFSCILGTIPLQRKLKPTAVPHLFNWTEAESASAIRRRERQAQRLSRKRLFSEMVEVTTVIIHYTLTLYTYSLC